MATAEAPALKPSQPSDTAAKKSSPWILGLWQDLILFVSTPLLIMPLVMMIQTPWMGVDVDTISILVAAFGGLGHHLPGMIRAYGDRDLFERFRWRFTFAPIFLLAVCIPLAQYHLNAMYLVLSVWGCWHALMQVYGFVRIYDVKVGSVSAATAYWDWLMCLSWFSTAQLFSSGKMSRLLEYWYNSGGMLIPPSAVHAFQWTCLAISVAVLIGFSINYLNQVRGGMRPNPAKLLMLASGIGFWWFAMVCIDNILLGVAVFEMFHDVQYLAIVWLYNCRRVTSSPNIGTFMRFVFRRSSSMAMLYVGLVLAYGTIGFFSRDLQYDSVKRTLGGFLWASTILHFYFDGFIWKVREKSTRAGLGLNETESQSKNRQLVKGELLHLLKWSPFVILLSWLSLTELTGSTLSSASNEARSWPPQTILERMLNIAEAVPNDLRTQRRAATTLANLDRKEEAIQFLNKSIERHPDFADGYLTLGEIYHVQNRLDEAAKCYRAALSHAKLRNERTIANYRLGEIYTLQGRISAAKVKFREALNDDPKYKPAMDSLKKIEEVESATQQPQ